MFTVVLFRIPLKSRNVLLIVSNNINVNICQKGFLVSTCNHTSTLSDEVKMMVH